jgi:TatD DNase family protein
LGVLLGGIMIFDTHAHYDDEAFADDREEILNGLLAKQVETVVNIGASILSSKESIELTKKYSFLYAAIGVHPESIDELSEEGILWLQEQALESKVVAIGEIGLDYFWNKENKELQEKWFRKQIAIARDRKLPMVIHSRDAAADTIRILKDEQAEKIGGIIHCYSYSKEMMKEYLDLGFYFGIGGVVTFKNAKKLKEVVEVLPMEKILLETDAPYLSPEPYRGKRNTSENLIYVAKEIAKIKNISYEEVISSTDENAHKIYQIERE